MGQSYAVDLNLWCGKKIKLFGNIGEGFYLYVRKYFTLIHSTNLNIMKQDIFKSDRYFLLFDALASHGKLLLRSIKSETYPSNIDIIFFGTEYIQIKHGLYGLKISSVELADTNLSYIFLQKFLTYDNSYIFEIESNDEKFYIASSFFRVFENQLEMNETSINFDALGKENEIAKNF